METKNFKELISENQIIIPIIQRDYAQGRDDEKVKTIRNEFLTALHNAVKGEGIKLDFVYGVIDSGVFTPLDGQQRLTTLFLLHWYAKNVLRQESYAELNLSRFTYKTHPSARQFCEKLARLDSLTKNTLDEEYLKFEKENNDKKNKKQPTLISDYIENKVTWWIAEWKDDPTIAGMLTMLDAIYMEFRNESSISLDNIEFYLYDLNDKKGTYNELTEDIYIKMNARGLELTPFEKVKGRILDKIGNNDGAEKKLDIASKFDGTWTDFMWDKAKNKPEPGKVIDGYFIRYIRFVCDTFLGERKNINDSDMVNAIDKKNYITFTIEAEEKRFYFTEYLESAFDCLSDYYGDGYLSSDEIIDPINKLKVEADNVSLFHKCLTGYTDPSNDESNDRKFSITQTLLLYAFIIKNLLKIDKTKFHKRLRYVRNLIWNSKSNKLSDLLDDTKAIICSEKLPDMVKAFSQEQLEEEKKKANQCEEWRRTGKPNMISALYQLEDHDCLHGKIGLFGDLTDLGVQYKDTFLALYRSMDENRIIQIGRALVHDNAYPNEPYIFRSTNAWRNMYHKVEGFYKYHQSVLKLLETLREKESVSDQLKEIIDEKIKKHIEDKRFDWRYYFVKYLDIHTEAYCSRGEYKKPGYNLTVMYRSTYRGRHRDAYLLAMHLGMKDNKNNYPLDEYGGPLTVKGYKIYNEESRLRVVKEGDKESTQEWIWEIPQDDGGYDTVDRVEMGINLIKLLGIKEQKPDNLVGLSPAGLAEFAEGEVVDGGAEGGEE